MYLSQLLDVNLTQSNADVLKRPSKVFNKVVSLFSGDLTPRQRERAEVMLSVLQRLNTAFRQAGIAHLVSIAVNDKVIFDGSQGERALEQGELTFEEGLESGTLSAPEALHLTVDGEDEKLRYVIQVDVLRRAKNGQAPVQVEVFGFIREFKRQASETDVQLSERIKATLTQKWADEARRQAYLDELESHFKATVKTLQTHIDALFPAGVKTHSRDRMMRDRPFEARYGKKRDRYDDDATYALLWFQLYGEDDAMVDELDVKLDTADLGLGATGVMSAEGSSWTDSISFGDGGSSCGSSCGGGCGGG